MYKLIKNSITRKLNWIIFIFSLQIFSIVMSLIQPFLNGKFIDLLIYANKYSQLITYIKLVLGVGILNIILSYFYKLLLLKLKNIMSFEFNLEVLEHLQKIPLELYDEYNPTYLNQRVKGDCEQLINYFLENTVSFIFNGVGILIVLVILFQTNIVLFFSSCFLLPLYGLLYFLFKKHLYEKNYQALEAGNMYFDYLNDIYNRNREIKVKVSYNNEKLEIVNKYKNYFSKFISYSKQSLSFFTMDNIVTIFFQIILFGIGGKQVIERKMTVGEFSIMNTYFNMILNFSKYYFNLGQNYQSVKVAKERIDNLFKILPEEIGRKVIGTIETISFKDINYEFKDKLVYFHNLNYSFNNSKIYCISGKNGAGKTTLINILMGINNLKLHGTVYINEINIKEIDTYLLRKNNISVMIQGEKIPSMLTKYFIFENIEKQKVEDALNQDIFLSVFCSKLFNINNIMDKNINTLSTGEKQMVLLLVTLIKEADLYVLDEPTSNLYNELTEGIMKILIKLKEKGKIILLISHDNNLINYCDTVFTI